ncbi:hypothetical protein HK102_012196 [Quaeritorhiza haematococci]|nr:hypothetical protein HK102_012196 [Quaeritorhiza haematococci]
MTVVGAMCSPKFAPKMLSKLTSLQPESSNTSNKKKLYQQGASVGVVSSVPSVLKSQRQDNDTANGSERVVLLRELETLKARKDNLIKEIDDLRGELKDVDDPELKDIP